MSWSSPFVVFRIGPEAQLTEVYHAFKLKDANYWMNYIAEKGDVLCKTPAHPKYDGKDGLPSYWCHKHTSGKSDRKEASWRAEYKFEGEFPAEQCEEVSQAA